MKIRQFTTLIISLLAFSITSYATTHVPNVIVKNNIIKQTLLNKASPTTIITHQQIKASGANTVSELLASQSSLQLQDLSGDGSKVSVSMRGFGDNAASNTLILIDGVPQNNPDLESVNLNQIPIQDVQRVEIMQGSQSVLYGDQAVGGVVNIITKHAKKSQMHVTAGVGSYNHFIYHLNTSNQYDNGLNYLLSGTIDRNDNYREHNKDNQQNIHANLGYHYNTGSITFRYNFHNQQLQYPGALTAAQINQNRKQVEPSDPNDNTHEQQHAAHVFWKQLISNNWSANNDFDYRIYTGEGLLFSPFTQSRQVVTINPKIIGFIHHSKLLFGTNMQHDRYQLDSQYSNELEHQTTAALYSQWQQPLFEKLSMIIGARTAHLETNSDSTSFNGHYHNTVFVTDASLLWRFHQDGSIYIRRAGNYRFPKAEENAAIPASVNHLKTQTGSTYDAGFKWIANQYRFNVNTYYMNLDNEIFFDATPTSTNHFGVNRNLSPTNRTGFDTGAQYMVNPYIQLGTEYSFVNAVFRSGNFKGKHIPFVAANTFHLSSTITCAPHWLFYAESVFTGKRYASGDDENVGKDLPGLVVVNAHISYQMKRLTLSLRVNNLFNKLYNSYASYGSSSGNEVFYPAPDRNVMLTASVGFW